MNFLDIIKSANNNLLRNKVRSFLTILAIFVGSFTIILNSAINAGVNNFIDKQVDAIGGEGYIEIAPSAIIDEVSALMEGNASVTEYNPNRGTSSTAIITDEELAQIRAIDGIKTVNPYYRASAEYVTSNHTDKKYNITLNLLPSNNLHTDMIAGQQVNADSSDPQIMLSEDYVHALGYDSNDAIINQDIVLGVKQNAKCYVVASPSECTAQISVKVTGILAPGVFSTGPSARVNIAANNAIYNLAMEGVPDSTKDQTTFVIGDVDPDKIDAVKAELTKLHFSALTVDDEVGMIRTFFDVILIVFNIFGAIALLAAAIGIINTLFMSVQERTREIGLDKALGMSNAKIFLSFSVEAVLLGFWGSIFGMIISMIIGNLANMVFHAEGGFLADFPTFNLVDFSPANVIPIILIIMLIAFLAGTAPARQAARKDPIEALRYE